MKFPDAYRRPEIFHILNIFIRRKDRVRFVFASVLLWADKRKVQREKQEKQYSRQKTNNLQQNVKFWLEKRNVIYWDYTVI